MKTHSPLLVNATGLPAEYFKGLDIGLRDFVKVAVYHPVVLEYIWLQIMLMPKNYWIGQVRSQTGMVDWIRRGDLVRFHPCNVYDVSKNSEVQAYPPA